MLRNPPILLIALVASVNCGGDLTETVDSGTLPDGGRADVSECQASDSSCDGDDTLISCVAGMLETVACPPRTTCIGGRVGAACEPLICEPGGVGCVNSRTAFTCENNGTVRAEFDCATTQYCEAGVCIDQLCEPSSRACRGDSVVECNGQGTEETVTRCAEADGCVESDHGCYCSEGACIERVCTPGRSQCVGAGVRVCSDDGSAFGEISDCPDDTQCVDGVCLETVCAPGERRCAGTTLLTCPAGATSWDSSDCADLGEVCRDFDGFADCGEPVCEPGTTSCTPDASALLRCDGTGGAVEELSCGDGVCLDGACVPIACTAGSLFCEGDEVRLCDSIGAGSASVTDCSAENVALACEDGACAVVECVAGWGDCDESLSTGCETPLDTDSDCGGCGSACDLPNTALATCTDGACAVAECADGWAECDDEAPGCETDVTTTEACGACDVSCLADGVETECADGVCRVSSCPEGTLDCDGDVENGCETPIGDADCGACDNDCGELTEAIAACDGVACVIEDCADGFADCDEEAGNGCEANLGDLATCGSCDNACAADGAVLECTDGVCRLSECADGFADCDEEIETGCEADLSTVETCDSCETSCAVEHGTAACEGGRCRVAACDEGWGDCDFRYDTGCETPLDTTTDCGECGTECEGGAGGDPVCGDGVCAFACDLGRGDCDESRENGCETNVDVSMAHCGECGAECELDGARSVCVLGSCVIDACDEWRENCDGVQATGCESDVLADDEHCGGCARACEEAGCFDGVCPEHAFAELDAHEGHGCGLLDSGLVCWGRNEHGQLGRGVASEEIEGFGPVALSDVVSVHTGDGATCALLADESVSCWGDGTMLPGAGVDRPEAGTVDLVDARAIDMHGRSVCALTAGGAQCWGLDPESPTTVDLIAGEFGSEVCVGADFGCATTAAGVACWGDNSMGQLADGTTLPREGALDIVGVGETAALACGSQHVCAVLDTGRVACWGSNERGQLGRGSVASAPGSRPLAVDRLPDDVIGAAATDQSTCVWTADGEVYCWGLATGMGWESAWAVGPLTIRAVGTIRGGAFAMWALTLGGQSHAWGITGALPFALGEDERARYRYPTALPWPSE